jgi:hypothetical protein
MNYLLTTTLGIIACLLFFNNTFSQNQLAPVQVTEFQTHRSHIIAVYGDAWVSDNPDAVNALENCFVNRISYLTEPLAANGKYPLLSSFPLMNKNNPAIVAIDYSQFNPSTFIPIHYNLPFFSDLKQVIRVDGTDYIIVIEPITIQH